MCHRLAHRLEASEVDNTLDGVGAEKAVQQRRVAHIALHKLEPIAAQLAQTLHHPGAAVAQVVEDEHAVMGHQLEDGVRANVASTAGDEDGG